ncbi:MAG: hydroxyacid dehydrogenase [Eubacterium sp.]|nr:hydroxyacid dehydrogenase [Eubacterium sp.]
MTPTELKLAKKELTIVVLEADAAGVSFDPLARFGKVITYEHTPQELVAERIREADIVVPNKCVLDQNTLADAKDLKLICEAATGYNNIDIDYCVSHGIPVTNARGYSTEAVVQHTFAMLLHLWEKLSYYADYVASGAYSSQPSFTHMGKTFHELSGKTYGIIGLGAIGRRVAEVATAFGMKVVYYSPSGNTYEVPYERLDFDAFLQSCDVISCHTPLTEKTGGLMNASSFEKCKPSCYFLNLARGPIVVEKDLVKALEEGQIAGAALDVFETEPIPPHSPLMKYIERHREEGTDKLLLTPHIAWAPLEARERLVEDVAQSIAAWLEGRPRSLVTDS